MGVIIVKSTKTYFCMWNFWCLLSWVSEANILLQMGHRNCIPLLGCGGGSSGRRTLLGLFKLDLSFWRRFLRDMCFFFKLPFPGCKRSCNSEATVESFCGSSRPPRAIWVMMDHIKGVWYSLLLHPKTITQSNPLHMYFINRELTQPPIQYMYIVCAKPT